MTLSVETQDIYKPSGKFNPAGMLVTLLGGAVAGIITGLVFYGLQMVLPFSIPMLFPAITGGLVGSTTLRLGSTIGRCRNAWVAVLVTILAGTAAGATEHVTDYLRFRAEVYNSILQEYPQARADDINFAIDEWIKEKTTHNGFVGYIFLKAASNSLEITGMTRGVPVSTIRASGPGLIVYWFLEMMLTVGIAGFINRNYSKVPYCDKCQTWRKYEMAVFGTDAHLEEAIEHLQGRNIGMALQALRKNPEGRVTRVEVEFCPNCYDSKLVKLVVVTVTAQQTWAPSTVWEEKLEPMQVHQIIQSA